MTIQAAFIVQDLETKEFLYPDPETGDVGLTPFLSKAGFFKDVEEAQTTAMYELGNKFQIFSFYTNEFHY